MSAPAMEDPDDGGFGFATAGAPAPVIDALVPAVAPEVEDMRIDAEDGNAYTKAEFIDAYGGLEEWEASAPLAANGLAPVMDHGCMRAPSADASSMFGNMEMT